MRLKSWLMLGALALPASLIALPCAAQTPPGAPSDADRAHARELFHGGVDAYAHGDFQTALDSFRNAYRLAPHPSVLANIANCHLQLHQPADALTNFERFLAESTNVAPAQRRDIESQIRQLRTQVAEVRLRITPDNTPGVAITVDGAPVVLSDTLRVAPGRHTIEVAAAGFEPERNEIDASAGTRADVWVRLRPPGSPPLATGPGPGTTGTPGTTGSAAPPGTGAVVAGSATEPGGGGSVAVVGSSATPGPEGSGSSAPPGGPGTPPVDTGTARGLAPGYFYAGVAVTAVGAVGWAVFGILATSANGTFNAAVSDIQNGVGDYNTALTRGRGAASNARTFAVASDVSMALTLAGGVTSVVLLTQTNFGRRGSVAVAPVARQDGAGLVAAGSF